MLICCDNLSTITIAHVVTYHMHTKHINIYNHFIHEKVASHKASLTYVTSKDKIAVTSGTLGHSQVLLDRGGDAKV